MAYARCINAAAPRALFAGNLIHHVFCTAGARSLSLSHSLPLFIYLFLGALAYVVKTRVGGNTLNDVLEVFNAGDN